MLLPISGFYALIGLEIDYRFKTLAHVLLMSHAFAVLEFFGAFRIWTYHRSDNTLILVLLLSNAFAVYLPLTLGLFDTLHSRSCACLAESGWRRRRWDAPCASGPFRLSSRTSPLDWGTPGQHPHVLMLSWLMRHSITSSRIDRVMIDWWFISDDSLSLDPSTST